MKIFRGFRHPGIAPACALTIEDALRRIPGVLSADVSAASHRGRIVWSDQAVKPSDWMQAAARAGGRPQTRQTQAKL